MHHISKKRRFSGEVALFYGVWYGAGRAFIELLRTDSLMLGKIRVSSLLSFVLCLASAALIVYFRSKTRETAHDSEYGSMFEASDEADDEAADDKEETIETVEVEETENV